MISKEFLSVAATAGTAGMTVIGIAGGIYNIMVDDMGSVPSFVLGIMGVITFIAIVLGVYNNTKIKQLGESS